MHLNVRGKLLATSAVLIAATLLAGVLWVVALGSVDEAATRMDATAVGPLEELGLSRAAFNENRLFLANSSGRPGRPRPLRSGARRRRLEA